MAKIAKKPKAPKVDTDGIATLGVARLAELLAEMAGTDAVLKRRLKFELAIASDPAAAAREIEKRIASLGRSKSHIDWQKVRSFAQDLDAVRAQIAGRLAEQDAPRAWELMWSFMGSAEASFDRCDDSNGEVGGVYHAALVDLAAIGERAAPAVADTIAKVIAAIEGNDYGQYDSVLELMAPLLGADGLARLRTEVERAVAKAEAEAAKTRSHETRRTHGLGYVTMADLEAMRPGQFASTLRRALRQVASLQGDVDGYIAAYAPREREMPGVVVDIARRLLGAGRAAEALATLEGAKNRGRGPGNDGEAEAIRFAALDALGRGDEAQSGRWKTFERTLRPSWLRDYVARLPDFEDFEAEQKALDHAGKAADAHAALHFFLEWPALEHAARLVLARHDKWNGDLYMLLSPAAETLAEKHPLAATVLLRAMIDDTLGNGRSSRYGHAARHLRECQGLAGRISDWTPVDGHAAYVERLKRAHGRKYGFWSLLK